MLSAKGKYTLYWKGDGRRCPLRVSLFITCYNDTLFPETGRAVVRVLERLGHTVDFPAGQTCCGQMHANTGFREEALPMVARFVDQFRHAEAVVVPSSSCVTTMREQYPGMAVELEQDRRHHGLSAELGQLLPRVFEFSEFLSRRLGLLDVGAFYPHRVTYHASCHGLRGLGARRRTGVVAAGCSRFAAADAPECRALLRLWRHLCRQERCGIKCPCWRKRCVTC